jgi:diguanylate cyclase (GGDEF)-like protein/putative nucleotidyltransferase with HDIG domain
MLPLLEPSESLPAHVVSLLGDARVAEGRGRGWEARKFLEDALRGLNVQNEDHAGAAAAIVRWIARSFSDEGVLDAALDCCEAAHAMSAERGDQSGVAHAINLRAVIFQRRGKLDEAEELYERVRELAESTSDTRLLAMAQQNLGTLANIRGEFALALDRYRSSLGGYRRMNAVEYYGPLLTNMALVLTDLRRWKHAERSITEALLACESTDDTAGRIAAQSAAVNLLLARCKWTEAEGAASTTLRAAESEGAHDALGELHKYHGIALRELEKFEDAERAFSRAGAIATARKDSLLAADVARELAEVHHRCGRPRESLAAFNRAHRLYSKMRAVRSLIDVDRRILRLEDSFIAMAREWGESIEAKDEYTLGHCVRVADVATRLAGEAGFDRKMLLWFRIGALLHDVGKIEVPSEILNKPGKLTDDEFRIMMRHCEAGVELLGDMEFPWDIRPMVLHHHEKWNGKGYPHGLSGENIPLPARILCIADVYDALTSTRSYRQAFGREEALGIMSRDRGEAFDPVLFSIFERMIARREAGAASVMEQTPAKPLPAVPDRRSSTAVSVAEVLAVLEGEREVRARRATPARVAALKRTNERLIPLTVVVVHTINASSRSAARALAKESPSGVRMEMADDIEEALQRVRDRSADAIIYAMPSDVTAGLVDLQRLRERLTFTPILVLGARRHSANASQFVALGAQDYLARDADRDTIDRVLRCAIERQRRENRIRQSALVDELTGLYNRRGFHVLARQHEKLAVRLGKRMINVCLDLDGLKQINDTYGHAEGDHALRETADLLRRTFRESDIVARLGGDEFGVLAVEMNEQWSESWQTRLMDNLQACNLTRSRGYQLSLSLGVAKFEPVSPLRVDELLAQADAAMYEAKRGKKRLSIETQIVAESLAFAQENLSKPVEIDVPPGDHANDLSRLLIDPQGGGDGGSPGALGDDARPLA